MRLWKVDLEVVPGPHDLVDRAGCHEVTVVDHDQIVGAVSDLVEQVARQEHRAAAVGEVAQQ